MLRATEMAQQNSNYEPHPRERPEHKSRKSFNMFMQNQRNPGQVSKLSPLRLGLRELRNDILLG